MSNLALANLTPAAVPRQPETATVTNTVAKKDSSSVNSSQVDTQKDVATYKEAVDAGILTSKTTKKFSFNDLLQKSLTKANADASNDKSGTPQTQKQVVVKTELTSDKKATGEKTKKQTTDNLVPVIPFLTQALQTSQTQSSTAVTNVKSLQNLPLRAISSTKTTAVESTKTAGAAIVEKTKAVSGKEVTTNQATAKEAKANPAVSEKAVKDAVETKDTSVAAKTENTSKNGVSAEVSNISQSKQGTDQVAMNLSSNTAGQDKSQAGHLHTQVKEATEVTKTEKSSLAAPKTQTKAQVSTSAETSQVAQAVITSRPADAVTPIVNRTIATESITATQVTTAATEKAAVQQAALTPAEQIIDKVQNTITGSTQQIQVTLTPAELGTIRLTFRQQDGQIEGLMEVQNPEVRKDVEKALPQIAAALAQNGIQVRRMEVAPMQNQQSNQESYQSPEHEFNPSDQHYLSNNGDSGGNGGSGSGISGRDAQLAEGIQDMAKQTFDMSGLNMYA